MCQSLLSEHLMELNHLSRMKEYEVSDFIEVFVFGRNAGDLPPKKYHMKEVPFGSFLDLMGSSYGCSVNHVAGVAKLLVKYPCSTFVP